VLVDVIDFSLNEIDFEEEVEGTATNLAFSSEAGVSVPEFSRLKHP
jgi:hypothetical protein